MKILCGMIVLILLTACQLEHPGDIARVVFVGTADDADCAILVGREGCVVIDTGEEQDTAHILELLRRYEVETIDYLILTHPHKDHIGGCPAILKELEVRKILTPYCDKIDSRYQELLELAAQLAVPVENVLETEQFQCGDFQVTIYPPEELEYSKENNYSLAALVRHDDVNLFFAGDAQKKRMEEILLYDLPDIVLYKVSHHGRDQKAGATLISRMQPQHAVVTAYGPEGRIAEALEEAGSKIVCTRGQDAVFISDGREIKPESGID